MPAKDGTATGTGPATALAETEAEPLAPESSGEASASGKAVETTEAGSIRRRPARALLARLVPMLRPVRLAVALVVLALAASTAYFGLQWREQGQAQRQAAAVRATVLANGRTYAIDLSSYDYRHLDVNFRAVTANATGSFARQYKLVSSDLTQLISKYHATSKASVLAEAVQSVDGDHAVLLLFVDQAITNTSTKTPRVESNRMRMSLVRSGGRWLLDNVQLQ